MHLPARLGVGPMSKNAVDAAIAFAYARREPLMLIASRRQIESAAQGGGYVEGWDTRTFADYVRSRDPDRLLLLCRDHGGPYQQPRERLQRYSAAEAMDSAAASFEEDLAAGFDLLHLDTSADLDGVADTDTAIERTVDLYERVAGTPRPWMPMFEIGFEDQGLDTNDPLVFEVQLAEVLGRLRKLELPPPTFVVAQTATKVVETGNVGALKAAPVAVTATVRALAATCRRHGVALKAHNCDYLPVPELSALVRAGVDAFNVAPELGVAETREFVALLREAGLTGELDRFLQLAYDSDGWRKWMAADTRADDTARALIAGHGVYATPEFAEIKAAAAAAVTYDLDERLRRAVTAVIAHHASALPTKGPVPA